MTQTNGNDETGNNSTPVLTGKDLLDYVELNRVKLENDGDSLCIGAGYGKYNEDGSAICRLDLFSTELIKAKESIHIDKNTSKARDLILNSYNLKALQEIGSHGCLSGKAIHHLQIKDNEEFFDENEQEITVRLEDHFGINYLKESSERYGGDSSHWKHIAVWRFIELIANEEISKYLKQ